MTDQWMTVAQAAVFKNTSTRTVTRILKDQVTRSAIFPHAERVTTDRNLLTWRLHVSDVLAWQPRKPGQPRKTTQS